MRIWGSAGLVPGTLLQNRMSAKEWKQWRHTVLELARVCTLLLFLSFFVSLHSPAAAQTLKLYISLVIAHLHNVGLLLCLPKSAKKIYIYSRTTALKKTSLSSIRQEKKIACKPGNTLTSNRSPAANRSDLAGTWSTHQWQNIHCSFTAADSDGPSFG